MRDYFARISPDGLPPGITTATFVVNTNSPLINKLYALHKEHPEIAALMAEQLYQLSKLSQKEFTPSEHKAFISNSFTL